MGRSPFTAAALGLALTLWAHPVLAQTGDGNLRGYVKDESGAVLPGVSVTATSPELLAPVATVSDGAGLYRLNNLPPGTYVITAELPGLRDRAPRGHPGPRRGDLRHRHRHEAQHGAGDHHRHRRIADDRGQQADDVDHARPRADPRRANLVAPGLQRRPRPGPRRLVAQRRRRRRPPLLLLQGRGHLLARLHPRGRAGRVVPRLVGPLDRVRRRHRAGHRAEAERRRRGVAHRHRRGDEHPGAARRQPVQGLGHLRLPGRGLEQRQHQGRQRPRRPAHRAVGEAVRPVAGRPDRQEPRLVLRGVPPRRPHQRHQPLAAERRQHRRPGARLRAVRQLT